MKSYVNQKFNKLTIIRQYQCFPFTRQRVDCRCECGKETKTSLSKVILGITKSCGCAQKGAPKLKLRKEYGYSSFRRLLCSYQYNAKRKGYAFELDESQAKLLFESPCFYCGTPPSKIMKLAKGYGQFHYNGIDRKNNEEGYSLTNSVSCCSRCNYAKNKMSMQEFLSWIRQVAKHTDTLSIT